MPRLKVSGHVPKVLKGITIRLDEGSEFRMDVTRIPHPNASPGSHVQAYQCGAGNEDTDVQGFIFIKPFFYLFLFCIQICCNVSQYFEKKILQMELMKM